MRSSVLVAAAAITAFVVSAQQSHAIDGIGVFTMSHDPQSVEQRWSAENMFWRGKIVKATIAGNQVTSRDTLFHGLGCYPTLSLDGQRIAFFRWGYEVGFRDGEWHDVAGTADAQCYLSVVNTDGSGGVENILEVPYLGIWQEAGESSGMLDWPAGDWIYYERPTKSGEIWRVNSKDASRNQLVCSYPTGTGIRMWAMSLDAEWVGTQCWVSGEWVHNGIHSFPLTNNSISSSVNAGLAGCNASVSCGGNRMSHYIYAPHSTCHIEAWNKGAESFDWDKQDNHDISDLENWLSEDITVGAGGADQIRWSVNSEKWLLRAIGYCDQAMAMRLGANSIAVNWKDKQAINISRTPRPSDCSGSRIPSYYSDAGDLWIDFGAGSENKWEDEDGTMHQQVPLTFDGTASGTDLHHASASYRAVVIDHSLAYVRTDGAFGLDLIDASGRTAGRFRGHAPAAVELSSIRPGLYLMRATMDGRSVTRRIAVTR